MNETITPYPFEAGEDILKVKTETTAHMQILLGQPLFRPFDQEALLSSFETYYAFANMYFNEEEALRENEVKGANLFYHNRTHAVEQATYDAISLTDAILARNDRFSAHLTPEGTLAIVLAAMFHDTGYVSDGPVENYAARTPIHVNESMATFESMINLLGLPQGLDHAKVKKLGMIGIHGTHFPFTSSHRNESQELMHNLTIEERKEAQIVRLTTQFADLGGQCARPDYFPQLVINLRREMDEALPNLGTNIIGSDAELQPNCEHFLNTFVRKASYPTKNVETTAIAFVGPEKSQVFRNAWKAQPIQSSFK